MRENINSYNHAVFLCVSVCVCVFSELYQSLQQLPAAAVSSVSVQSD